MEVAKHSIEKKLDNRLIWTPFVSLEGQLVDVLTKGLSGASFQSIIGKLRMDNIYSPT